MSSPLHERLRAVVDSPPFERAIMGLIVVNATTLGLETSERAMALAGPLLIALDRIILSAFVIELATRLYVRRLAFFRDPWRVFDLIVVGIAVLPATGNLSILRAFRILRVLRLIGTIPSMRRVVAGLLNAIPGMGSIALLLGLIFYVFAVMATKLFGASFPGVVRHHRRLGLFAVPDHDARELVHGHRTAGHAGLPGRLGLLRPVHRGHHLAVLNLFVGIIVDAMQSQHLSDAHAEREAMMTETGHVLGEVRALRAELAQLRSELRRGQHPPSQIDGAHDR